MSHDKVVGQLGFLIWVQTYSIFDPSRRHHAARPHFSRFTSILNTVCDI